MSRILVALVLMFVLVGCGGENEGVPASSSQESSSTQIPDDVFVLFIKEHTNDFDNATDEEIVTAAHAVCTLWDSGGSFLDVAEAVVMSGVDPEDGGFLAAASTEAYCPQYSDQLP